MQQNREEQRQKSIKHGIDENRREEPESLISAEQPTTLSKKSRIVNEHREKISYSRKEYFVYSMLSLAVTILFAFMIYSSNTTYPWYANWSSTTGTVLEKSYRYKFFEIHYRFQADGIEYINRESFRIYGNTVSVGDSLKIRYDPNQPTHSFIETGPTIVTFFWCLLTLISFIFFVSCLNSALRRQGAECDRHQ